MSEESGKRSFTRISGLLGLLVVLSVFIWTAVCAGRGVDPAGTTALWQVVNSMFNAVLIFVGILYGTNKAANKGPEIAAAIRGTGAATEQPPKQPGQTTVAPQP